MLAGWFVLAALGVVGTDHAPASSPVRIFSDVLSVEDDGPARALDAGWRTANGPRRIRVASTRRHSLEPDRPTHGLIATATMPGMASLAIHELLRTSTAREVGRGPGGFDRPGHGPLSLC
jgi:hypothetical protein